MMNTTSLPRPRPSVELVYVTDNLRDAEALQFTMGDLVEVEPRRVRVVHAGWPEQRAAEHVIHQSGPDVSDA